MYRIIILCFCTEFAVSAMQLDYGMRSVPSEIKYEIVRQLINSCHSVYQIGQHMHNGRLIDRSFKEIIDNQTWIEYISKKFLSPRYNAALAIGARSYVERNENFISRMQKIVTESSQVGFINLEIDNSPLIKNVVDLNYTKCVQEKMQSPLSLAIGCLDVFKRLLDCNADPNTRDVAIQCFKIYKKLPDSCFLYISLLLDYGMDPNGPRSLNLATLLIKSIKYKWSNMVNLLVNWEPIAIDPNIRQFHGNTALHMCAQLAVDNNTSLTDQQKEIDTIANWIQVLIKKGANKALLNCSNKLPEDIAQIPDIKNCLKIDVPLNNNDLGPTIFHYLADESTDRVLEELKKENHQKLVLYQDAQGYIPLHDAARALNVNVMHLQLLALSAEEQLQEINMQNAVGRTPLHCVMRRLSNVKNNNTAVRVCLEFLIEKGAGITIKDFYGKIPLYYLERLDNTSIKYEYKDENYYHIIKMLTPQYDQHSNQKRKRENSPDNSSSKRRKI